MSARVACAHHHCDLGAGGRGGGRVREGARAKGECGARGARATGHEAAVAAQCVRKPRSNGDCKTWMRSTYHLACRSTLEHTALLVSRELLSWRRYAAVFLATLSVVAVVLVAAHPLSSLPHPFILCLPCLTPSSFVLLAHPSLDVYLLYPLSSLPHPFINPPLISTRRSVPRLSRGPQVGPSLFGRPLRCCPPRPTRE